MPLVLTVMLDDDTKGTRKVPLVFLSLGKH